MQQATRGSAARAGGLFLLVFLIFAIATAAANAAGIEWNEASPITWSLFQCSAPADAAHRSEAAAIHMTIRWHASYAVTSNGSTWIGHVQSVTVTNTMEPSLSWVVAGKASARVLQHEQSHFDLNEVYRRKLAILLPCLQAQSPTKEGAAAALDAALRRKANEVLSQLQKAQARYDAETGHGNDAAGQARWEAQIAAWLLNPTAAP